MLVDEELDAESRGDEELFSGEMPILFRRVLDGGVFELDVGGVGQTVFLERVLRRLVCRLRPEAWGIGLAV